MAATNTIVTDYIQSAFRILELSIDVPAHWFSPATMGFQYSEPGSHAKGPNGGLADLHGLIWL